MNTDLNLVKKLVEEIKPANYNPRKISKKDWDALERSLEKFGLVEPLIINKRTGNLVGGHQRLDVLKARGVKEILVNELDISLEDEKALNIALNKISGEWHNDRLKDIITDLHAQNYDLAYTGFDQEDIKDFFGEKYFEEIGLPYVSKEDELVPVAEHIRLIKTGIKRGDIFILGKHRLMCGDSTNETDVEALLSGRKPVLMVTDPPYGVEYDPSWRNETNLKNGIKRPTRAEGKVQNDDIADWSSAWELFPGDVAYVWHAGKFSNIVQNSLEKTNFSIINQIIWAKPHFILSRGDYHWKHEPCWYAVRNGKNHNWQGDRTQTTVWEIAGMNCFGASKDSNDEATGHGTQKPVECMKRPIINNSQKDDSVYDPFGGSGTTLIAAEVTERECLMMELDPQYCQVIIDRWEKLTGGKAEKL